MTEMKMRGDVAMGFDQHKVSHHFRLTSGGGSIEVSAKNDNDAESRQQIRDHLRRISHKFADGVFTGPIATHAQVPPGVTVMRARKARISYTYEETPTGARVVIATSDGTALKAVHCVLKYQIREHDTGDSSQLGSEPVEARTWNGLRISAGRPGSPQFTPKALTFEDTHESGRERGWKIATLVSSRTLCRRRSSKFW
jgi:hypothetical protein